MGRKVLTRGDLCRWVALCKLQSLTALQVSKETRPQDRVGPSWTLEEDPSWEACSRAKARHSWSRLHFQKPRLGGFRFRLDRCPVWRLICLVRGSGCFKHDARCHLGGRVTPHPGTPLSQGSWVNTTPTHGPRWPSGCGDSPNGLEGQVFTFYWFSIYLWKINLFLLVPSFCLLDEHKWSGSEIGHLNQKETRVWLLLCHLPTGQTKPSATWWWHPKQKGEVLTTGSFTFLSMKMTCLTLIFLTLDCFQMKFSPTCLH